MASLRTLGVLTLSALWFVGVRGLDSKDCVYITVSSLWRWKEHDRALIERELELNWVGDPLCGSPDRVGLFPQDPKTIQDVEETAMFWTDVASYPDGYVTTNISLGRPPLPGGWDDPLDERGDLDRAKGDHCYPFWVASFNDTTLLNSDCLKIRPTWMADHKKELSRMTLSQLLIPGTHNSACYQHGNRTSPGRDAFSRYLLTQDADVWTQLVHGIRYLDLRIGFYTDKNDTSPSDRFWVNHAMVRITPVVPILRQVVRFVTSSPDELVIVDFHRFPIGMEGHRKRHRQLVAVLRKELGEVAIVPPADLNTFTLAMVWAQRGRVVVTYGDSIAAADSKWLWPPLSQKWGSIQSASALQTYIEEVMTKPPHNPSAPWAIMAELTPTPFDVLFDVSGSLRQMADDVNRNVTHWIRDFWWQRANIVATDFFLGNNLIDVAVRTNLRKALMDIMDGI